MAGIIALPHGDDSTNCNECGGTDGTTYAFEVATKDKYRFWYYCNPDYACDCNRAHTVMEFAARLERELDFHYIR